MGMVVVVGLHLSLLGMGVEWFRWVMGFLRSLNWDHMAWVELC